MESQIQKVAFDYVNSGLSILPIGQEKRPVWRLLPETGTLHCDGNPKRGWFMLKSRRPTPDELRTWYPADLQPPGIGVICGQVSGNLEVIDIDSWDYVEPWLNQLRQRAPDLPNKLVMVRTPRPGLHCYYRSPEIAGNQKLAQIPDPTADNPNHLKTIIETRGEGGYAVVPPSPCYCHPTYRPYEYVNGKTLTELTTLTESERNLLVEVSRSFDQTPERTSSRPETPQPPAQRAWDRSRPGDDFDYEVPWDELLEKHGWTYSHLSEGVHHWTRPGKTEGTSATVDYGGHDLLHVFTSNAPPLENDKSYSKFAFYTLMEHDGDFSEAAKALREQGYGQPTISSTKSRPRVGRPHLPKKFARRRRRRSQ